jgi:hypothetical protein
MQFTRACKFRDVGHEYSWHKGIYQRAAAVESRFRGRDFAPTR